MRRYSEQRNEINILIPCQTGHSEVFSGKVIATEAPVLLGQGSLNSSLVDSRNINLNSYT